VASELEPPAMPAERLKADGWTYQGDAVETVYKISSIKVLSATIEYEDTTTRDAVREATDGTLDHRIRFFTGSRLKFSPSLPMGTTIKMVSGKIRGEATKEFAHRLRDRGLEDLTEGEEITAPAGDDKEAKLTEYTATNPLPDYPDAELPVQCWAAFWIQEGAVRFITGGYPTVELASHLGLNADNDLFTRSPDEYRDYFFSLLQDVG
jgi:hypothetical protein